LVDSNTLARLHLEGRCSASSLQEVEGALAEQSSLLENNGYLKGVASVAATVAVYTVFMVGVSEKQVATEAVME